MMRNLKSRMTRWVVVAALALTAPLARAGWWCEAGCTASYYLGINQCGTAYDVLLVSCGFVVVSGGGADGTIECVNQANDFNGTCMQITVDERGDCVDDCRNG